LKKANGTQTRVKECHNLKNGNHKREGRGDGLRKRKENLKKLECG